MDECERVVTRSTCLRYDDVRHFTPVRPIPAGPAIGGKSLCLMDQPRCANALFVSIMGHSEYVCAFVCSFMNGMA